MIGVRHLPLGILGVEAFIRDDAELTITDRRAAGGPEVEICDALRRRHGVIVDPTARVQWHAWDDCVQARIARGVWRYDEEALDEIFGRAGWDSV